METNVSTFFQPPARGFPELSNIVRDEIDRLLRPRSVPMLPRSDCLFSNIRNYLALLVTLLPKLAEQLLSSPHVASYINTQIAEVDDDTDFSDLQRFNTLCEQQMSLRLVYPVFYSRDPYPSVPPCR
jgi:hypothetical protein